jgi:hypothetical protein
MNGHPPVKAVASARGFRPMTQAQHTTHALDKRTSASLALRLFRPGGMRSGCSS